MRKSCHGLVVGVARSRAVPLAARAVNRLVQWFRGQCDRLTEGGQALLFTCPTVGPAERVSGAELGLYALGDLAHIRAALKLGLELTHQRTHSGHTFRIDPRERLVDESVDLFSRELGG